MSSDKPALPVESVFEEPEEIAARGRFLGMMAFVAGIAIASLAVYLWMRPANRHLEPTPYDTIISQLRSNMSEDDVMALFRAANENGGRGDLSAYDETIDGTMRRVVSYRLDNDEPLRVRMGGSQRLTVAEWCYRDHCHDNIE